MRFSLKTLDRRIHMIAQDRVRLTFAGIVGFVIILILLMVMAIDAPCEAVWGVAACQNK